LINRQPLSRHLSLLAEHRFQVVNVEKRTEPVGHRFRPASPFHDLTSEDKSTSGAFIQAIAT
jgi:hypothetical protein